MVKFVAIKINYDDRDLPVESKYAVVPNPGDLQRFRERFENERIGGYGFHECLNFQIREDVPVQAYLVPTGIPKDMDDEYVIFSFTYKGERSFPDHVLGVHGRANLISRGNDVSRLGIPRISELDKLKYHLEAEPDFVILFSSPLPNRYKSWGQGLRYLYYSLGPQLTFLAMRWPKENET